MIIASEYVHHLSAGKKAFIAGVADDQVGVRSALTGLVSGWFVHPYAY
jgi:hypothetical protein